MPLEQNKQLVQDFYCRLWNKWDLSAVQDILSPDISFRGSLGLTKKGHSGFIDYVELVRSAFPDFHNTVEELIAEADNVVARLTYVGTHRGELFGIPPTGRQVKYAGIAIFRITGSRITDVWVLGDTLGLMRQIGTSTVS